ncbi:FG-GAP-like repeat-containing protein [Micromonospora sp. NPDC049559]|uniref:FG-GAP-like repeat-containing protein n=1 Tax=Micromonospora sp. NPDC049559 TaxID=3155923 RepID=UPI003417A872
MWSRRIGAMLATMISTVVVAEVAATDARAAPADPIYGDLNGDHLMDRVTLGVAPPNRCGVTVELGLVGGGYQAPRRYSYPEPGGASLGACPDMGVAVDLGGDGVVELVLAWFDGRPPGYLNDLLVLRNYTPVAGFRAIYQPSSIGLADFNGDGLQDVYEWTDQGDGFVTYLNTSAGTLVPGPVHWCSGRPQFVLADFDRDGGMDVVIAYYEGCGAYFSGVVVVLDDGTVVHVEADVLGEAIWRVGVEDFNGDTIPDLVTENLATGEIIHHMNNGYAVFTPGPIANDDKAVVSPTRKTSIAVMANDFATGAARLSIVTPPAHGTVTVTSARTVVYQPAGVPGPRDRFVYRLTEDGRSDPAAVNLTYGG